MRGYPVASTRAAEASGDGAPSTLDGGGRAGGVARGGGAAQLPAGAARRRKPLEERERRLDGRARLVALLAREGRHLVARRRVERQDLPRRGARDGAGPRPRGRRQRLARDGAARRRVDEGFDEPYSGWLSTSRLVVARGPAPALFREGSHRSLPAGRERGRLPRHDDFAATLGPRARCASEARVRIEDRVPATCRGTAPRGRALRGRGRRH